MRHRSRWAILLGAGAVLALAGCASGGGGAGGAVGVERGAAAAESGGSASPVMSELPRFDRSLTIAIVVRHAEKAATGGSDPHLSDAGQARARALARSLRAAGVTAVITTQYVRTAETAAPTARAAGVTPETVPVRWDSVPGNAAAIAAAVRRHTGGVVLVVGHSNTVADIVEALGASKPNEICDSEYDRLEVVAVPVSGPSRVIESRYGAPTPVEAGCASMH